jgi:formyl-CoA transferase
MKMMAPVVDFGTAMACALGTMMALYERQRSGMGQEVGASLLRTALTYSGAALIEEAVLRVHRKATMNRAPHYAPSDMFRCKDGRWIICQVIGNAMFARWARTIGKPELAEEERFEDDLKRGEQGEYLSELMSEWCARFTGDEALARLEQARVPAGPVNSPRDVLEDRTVQAAGVLHPVEYPGVKSTVPLAATPVTLSRTPPEIRRRPPRTGEHTDEVLREIGYSPERIAGLRAQGVV